MALQPGASVKSKYDLTRSLIGRREEYGLVAGTNFVEESQLMVAGGTTETLATTSITGAAFGDARPIGFALNGQIQAITFTNYETGTVPAAPGPYTFQLDHNNLAANTYSTFADAFVFDTTSGAELEVAGAAVAATSVALNAATGIMTFDANEAGNTFYVRYRWTLTVAEALAMFRQSPYGRSSESTFDRVQIATEHCIFFTSMYDADCAWVMNQQLYTAVNGNPVTGAGGVLTLFDNNADGTCFGQVISLPSASDPYLGVEYPAPVTAV